MFKNRNTMYSSCLTDGGKELYHTYMIRNDHFYDVIGWQFEGYTFPVPRNYDEVLTNNFGNYMNPPPLEEQKPHHELIKVSFNTTSDI